MKVCPVHEITTQQFPVCLALRCNGQRCNVALDSCKKKISSKLSYSILLFCKYTENKEKWVRKSVNKSEKYFMYTMCTLTCRDFHNVKIQLFYYYFWWLALYIQYGFMWNAKKKRKDAANLQRLWLDRVLVVLSTVKHETEQSLKDIC